MNYNYNNVMKVIQNIEEEVLFDVEAPAHWYEIKFNNDELIIYEVDEYHFDGDEWGAIETKTNTTEIERFECSLVEFTNFVIQYYDNRILYMEASYPQEAYITNKIVIRGVKNDDNLNISMDTLKKSINEDEDTKLLKQLKADFNREWDYTTEALDSYIEYCSTYGGDYTGAIAKAMNECFDALIEGKSFCDKEGLINRLKK